MNTHTAGFQMYPAIASLGDAGLVVVWQSCPPWTAGAPAIDPQDGSKCGIFGQRYDSDGVADGPEFQVNTLAAGHQRYPSPAGFGDGRFVVTWQSWAEDSQYYGIFAQLFNPDGSKEGDEFQVNTHAAGAQEHPRAASLSNDLFVIVWQSFDQDDLGFGVFGQRYDADGMETGTEFLVNTCAVDHQSAPSVATFGGGGFVTVWQGKWQDGDHWGIFGQRFDSEGERLHH